MKKNILLIVMCLMNLVCMAQAAETDVLIDKLIDKGILNSYEAEILKSDISLKVATEMADGAAISAPSWTQKMQLTGDFRLRYQRDVNNLDKEKTRYRVRSRIGLLADISPKIKAGIGLCSGSADSRSTNQSMDNYFTTKAIMLDYAYGSYEPMTNLLLTMGKMPLKNVLWSPGDLIWDTDLTPEGGVISYNGSQGDIDFFVNGGSLILDPNTDVYSLKIAVLNYIQAGIRSDINENMSFQTAVSMYKTIDLAGKAFSASYSSKTNSTIATVNYKYEYEPIVLSVAYDWNNFMPAISNLCLFAEGVLNRNSKVNSAQNGAYLAGITLGTKKLKNPGEWSLLYSYRRLEKDSWLDILPDSDAYSGGTNCEGSETIVAYQLDKNLSLAIDYYAMQKIGESKVPKKLFQVDLGWKF